MARPRYKVAPGAKFYDNWTMREEGEEVDYDGDPGENLIPVNAEAKAAKARAGKVQPSAFQALDAAERQELKALRADKAEREKAA